MKSLLFIPISAIFHVLIAVIHFPAPALTAFVNCGETPVVPATHNGEPITDELRQITILIELVWSNFYKRGGKEKEKDKETLEIRETRQVNKANFVSTVQALIYERLEAQFGLERNGKSYDAQCLLVDYDSQPAIAARISGARKVKFRFGSADSDLVLELPESYKYKTSELKDLANAELKRRGKRQRIVTAFPAELSKDGEASYTVRVIVKDTREQRQKTSTASNNPAGPATNENTARTRPVAKKRAVSMCQYKFIITGPLEGERRELTVILPEGDLNRFTLTGSDNTADYDRNEGNEVDEYLKSNGVPYYEIDKKATRFEGKHGGENCCCQLNVRNQSRWYHFIIRRVVDSDGQPVGEASDGTRCFSDQLFAGGISKTNGTVGPILFDQFPGQKFTYDMECAERQEDASYRCFIDVELLPSNE